MRPNVEILRAKVADWLTDVGKVEWMDGYIRVGGVDVPNWVTRYDGPILVQPQSNYRTKEVGGAVVTVTRYDVTLPADTHVEPEDRLTITSCAFDALLNGSTMNVVDVSLDTWQLGRYCVASRVS